MKKLFLILATAGLLAVSAPAQDVAEDGYVKIYELIQAADQLNTIQNRTAALIKYREAQAALKKLQADFPAWQPRIISFRSEYLESKIAPLAAATAPRPVPVPAVVAPAPAPVATPVAASVVAPVAALVVAENPVNVSSPSPGPVSPAFIPPAPARADMGAISESTKRDLDAAFAELTGARRQVEEERTPLVQEMRELERKVIETRRTLEKSQRFQENQMVELNALKTDVKRRTDEVKFVEALLIEYQRAFETRIHICEMARYKDAIDSAKLVVGMPDLSREAKLEKQAALIVTALGRVEAVTGGETFAGRALAPSGRLEAGRYALIGPLALFASDQGETAGMAQMQLGTVEPAVQNVPPEFNAAIKAVVTTGKGNAPLDSSMGNALKLAAINKGFIEQLEEGGIVMIPLLGLGLAVFVLAGVKWWQFLRLRLTTERDLQTVLNHVEARKPQQAIAHARTIPGLAGEMLVAAVEHMDEKKEYIEEVLYEKMLMARTQVERGLPFLALAATTGPLLGLLGTVTGMIATFKIISGYGGGDPKMLAAGISEALICTATGMAIAIPALLFHAFLSRRAKGILGSMEQTAVGFVNGVPDRGEAVFWPE